MSTSQRDRDRERVERTASSSQPKQRSKSNKRGANKSRRSAPQVCNQLRREKMKACTVPYVDHGFTTDNRAAARSSIDSPYEAMRKTVQTAINSAKIFDMEKNSLLTTLRRNKLSKADEILDPTLQPPSPQAGPVTVSWESPKEGDGADREGKGDECGTSRPTAGMAGNEDDEEYQVEEEEAERIISQEEVERIISQGLSLQEMTAVAYQTKKSITEQMRELQVCVMERAARKVEPKDLLDHFRHEGYFNYNYDQDARTTSAGVLNGTKKDTLYVIIGLSRKTKIYE